ncbi:MAG: hypothetical protein DRI44_04685, partial [Chlamydiae bacterium]
WRAGELESWRAGELVSWRAGELESWRAGELESWRAGELESWRAGELGKTAIAVLQATTIIAIRVSLIIKFFIFVSFLFKNYQPHYFCVTGLSNFMFQTNKIELLYIISYLKIYVNLQNCLCVKFIEMSPFTFFRNVRFSYFIYFVDFVVQ